MEFKEAYKKGLKTGKTITNGIYKLKFINNELEVKTVDKTNHLNWFMSDANTLRNWAGQIFGSDVDLNSPKLMELKNAAEISLSELEDDIAKIREFLASYIPPNNN